MSGGKKRVRFAETHEVREFELPEAIRKRPRPADPMAELERALDPMAQLESGLSTVCIYEGGASLDPAAARSSRAASRREALLARFEEGSSFLGSLEAVEARYEEPEERFNDAGVPMEPFHLKNERAEGYFDESGCYIEYREDIVPDSWADSLADVEVDEAWLARVRAAQQAQQAGQAEQPAADLEPEELRGYKQRLADLLLPGETTLDALRRLGRQRVERPAAQPAEDGQGERAAQAKPKQVMPSPVREAFDRLTEYSSILMEHGDYVIHSQRREQILRSLLAAEEGAEAGDPSADAAAGEGHAKARAAAAAPSGAPPSDAGALLAQQLLAGAGGGAAAAGEGAEEEGEGAEEEGEGGPPGGGEGGGLPHRMSTDGEAGPAAGAAAAGQEGELLDMFAGENQEQQGAAERLGPAAAPSGDGGGAAGAAAGPAGEAGEPAAAAEQGAAAGGAGRHAAAAAARAEPIGSGAAADQAVPPQEASGQEQAEGDTAQQEQDAGFGRQQEQQQQQQQQQGWQQRQGNGGDGGGGGAGEGLEGFEYDSASGHWYNSQLGCFYDANRQLYGDAATGVWYKYTDGQYTAV